METMTTTATAMTAVRDTARPWRGANTAHADTFRSVQGWSVPFAGFLGADVLIADRGTTGIDATAPITGVVCPRLEAPPV
jgi:hypothetical protein